MMEEIVKRRRRPSSAAAPVSAKKTHPTSVESDCSALDPNELRLKRIQDLMKDALDERNPLQSNLRATAGDIMSLAYRLKQAIGRSLEGTSNDIIQFEKLGPSIEMYLKLARQADRFAHIDLKLLEARRGKTAGS